LKSNVNYPMNEGLNQFQNLQFFNISFNLKTMSKTALFYSPEGGNVNGVAVQLGEMIGTDNLDVIPAKEAESDIVSKYNQIILVGSTVGADHWNNEVIEDEWTTFFTKIEDLSFENKKVAIVGLGNCVLYPSHFADGMADLYERITKKSAQVFGFVDAEEYDFEDSEALNEEGSFCGLALDEDNEAELSAGRLEKWIEQLRPDFDF